MNESNQVEILIEIPIQIILHFIQSNRINLLNFTPIISMLLVSKKNSSAQHTLRGNSFQLLGIIFITSYQLIFSPLFFICEKRKSWILYWHFNCSNVISTNYCVSISMCGDWRMSVVFELSVLLRTFRSESGQ